VDDDGQDRGGALQHVKSGLLDLLRPYATLPRSFATRCGSRCTISMALSAEHATVTGNALLKQRGPPALDDQGQSPAEVPQ